MDQINNYFLPRLGEYIRLQGKDDWGIGQVQSVDGDRVIANFEEAGKRVINLQHANVVAVDIDNDAS